MNETKLNQNKKDQKLIHDCTEYIRRAIYIYIYIYTFFTYGKKNFVKKN